MDGSAISKGSVLPIHGDAHPISAVCETRGTLKQQGTDSVNLKFLETFVWVARLKSFRLTAEKLFSTQASISSRIAALEDEMGVRLFVRDSKGVC
jgi:hypothetical protein